MNAQIAKNLYYTSVTREIAITFTQLLNDIEVRANDRYKSLNLSQYAYNNFNEDADIRRFMRESRKMLRKLGFKVRPVLMLDIMARYPYWINWEVRWS